MKKFLSVFLTAALAVSMLAGCGSKNETVTAKVIDIDLTEEEYAWGVDKNQPELLEKTNEFIAENVIQTLLNCKDQIRWNT